MSRHTRTDALEPSDDEPGHNGDHVEEYDVVGAFSHPDDYGHFTDPDTEPPVDQFFREDLPLRRRRPSKAKRLRRRRRTVVLVIVLAFFVVVVLGLALFLRDLLGMNEVKDYAGPGTGEVTFVVEPGAAAILISQNLESKDIVADGGTFLDTFQQKADGRPIQPGEYVMKKQMSSAGAAEVLLEEEPGVHYAAIASGLRQDEVLQVLSESTGVDKAKLEKLAEKPQAFGLPDQAPKLEGYLAPGEYRFEIGVSPDQIIQQMVDTTFERLEEAGVTEPDEQYRILTIASIVQAEAGEADYAAVAGAIENRLSPKNTETAGRIQSDATVTYGLGRKSYELTEAEKKDKSNPYNTYANKGLPVGPIGSPSEKAIEAAANPKDVPYYYWVTVNLDTGETKFSETLAEHNRNVSEYQQWCSEQDAGRCN